MTTQLSTRSSILILNGVRITGFSDDDNPVEFAESELATVKFGQDGTLYANANGHQGGEMTVKLLPS